MLDKLVYLQDSLNLQGDPGWIYQELPLPLIESLKDNQSLSPETESSHPQTPGAETIINAKQYPRLS